MKVDLVSEQAGPAGRNAHVHALAAVLAEQGHAVTVWSRREDPAPPGESTTADGVTVHLVDAGPAEPVPADRLLAHLPALTEALRAAWRADPPHVVHAHCWLSGLAAASAAESVVPVVQTFPALAHVERRHQAEAAAGPPGRVRAETYLARHADRVVATCAEELHELTRLGAPRLRIEVLPHGVDVATLTPRGPAHPRGGRPRIVALGRPARHKGVDEAVAALAGVPDAELVVAGGTGEGDPDIARLRALAAARGVADRVRCIGPVPRAEVPPLLRSADVVVCVPWYEPFGTVALEAMSCGRPVVASAVGGLVDTVVDGVTGVLVPAREPRATAEALRHVLDAPSVAEALGAAGRDRAVSRYGWDRVAAATAEVYHGVAGDRAGAGDRATVGGR